MLPSRSGSNSMIARRLVAAFTATLLAFPTSPLHAQSILVHPAVRTSPRGVGPHFWWTIAASPVDSKHLVVCGMRNRPGTATFMQAVLYGSDDGGETWRTLAVDSSG